MSAAPEGLLNVTVSLAVQSALQNLRQSQASTPLNDHQKGELWAWNLIRRELSPEVRAQVEAAYAEINGEQQ